MNNYVCYHLHSDYSLLDSCTKYYDYIYRAKELGMKALGFSEHGNIFHWIDKKQFCEDTQYKIIYDGKVKYFPSKKKADAFIAEHDNCKVIELPPIHYLHGCEVYLTEKPICLYDEDGNQIKVRDNFHTVLYAKDDDGFKELNKLLKISSQPDHTYYKNRITFDEFVNISDHIIKTSACLQSPLNKYKGDRLEELITHYDYLEIQPHISEEQKQFNQQLVQWSKEYNIPLIAATDTHSLNQYKAECRSMLMKSKGIEYTSEDQFDLTFKTYDELVDMFQKQDAIDEQYFMEAIDNTNKFADSIYTFELDKSWKYPKLYEDPEGEFKRRCNEAYSHKVSIGAIKPDKRYAENMKEEFRVFKKLNMIDFMLFMSDLMRWCKTQGINAGFGRGSVCGSTAAYLMDVTEVDPVKWNTIFSRFANENRVELGDVDVDLTPARRNEIYDHIISTFGENNTARVLTINTIAEKGAIDDIARGLAKDRDDDKYSLDNTSTIKALYESNPDEAKKEYPELFYYLDGISGTNISHGIHPAGIVVSPVTLPDNYGCMWDSDGNLVTDVGMEELHDVNLVKYDLLCLNTVAIVEDTCTLAGLPYPDADIVDWNDEEVWNHITDYPTGIFQFEASSSYQYMKKFKPRSIEDLTVLNACIRPSGESYRDEVFARHIHSNPSKMIDDMLANTYGRLVYQEQVIQFLQEICGLSGGEADSVRRGIASKNMDMLEEYLPRIKEGYCNKSDKPREVAEQECEEFIQVIISSSSYMFGFNHATTYSMLTYMTAYYRYHYPVEFCTAYMNNPQAPEDVLNGTNLAKEMGIKILPPVFRHSLGKYSCDASKREIYKGVESIRYLNNQIADELYALRCNEYNTFIDALPDITATSIDTRQLTILIKIGFFEEFGEPNALLKQYELYQSIMKRKTYKKSEIESGKCTIPEYLIAAHAGKVTDKQYSQIDQTALLKDVVEHTELPKTTVFDKMDYELEVLDYITTTVPDYDPRFCYVINIDGKFKKKYVTFYQIRTGKTTTRKCEIKSPIKIGDIVRIDEISNKRKWRKTGVDKDGKPTFEQLDETEPVVTGYSVTRHANST